jgi:moderate conductance mechanosensitive channel
MSTFAPIIALFLAAPPSDAERIARLEAILEADQGQLDTLRRKLDSGEHRDAQASFTALDARLARGTRDLQSLRAQKNNAEADALDESLKSLRERWQLARDRFDLVLKERRSLQVKSAALEKRIQSSRDELSRLLDHAHGMAETLLERIDATRQSIEIEQRLRDTARRKMEVARQARQVLAREFQTAAEERRPALLDELDAVNQRELDAANEERAFVDRLAALQDDLAALQNEQLESLRQPKVLSTDTPGRAAFAPEVAIDWLKLHGPIILVILLGMWALRWMVQVGSCRIARLVVAGSHLDKAESEDRAATLASVFRSTGSLVILVGGILMLLDQFGVPIGPLLGGAAVLGLAVAFGAQNLVKDYFTGFMVLMEDQYAVNDVVKINNVDGVVERITLRMTVLRDASGVAHFIPHGTVTMVSNMTYSWSRANLEIPVAYKEDTDRVMAVLKELCAELRAEEAYAPFILEDAEMLGVDAFRDSGVIVKFLVKTAPTKQWDVKRELLRRIKKRFDEEGIEIPLPQRVVHHRGSP